MDWARLNGHWHVQEPTKVFDVDVCATIIIHKQDSFSRRIFEGSRSHSCRDCERSSQQIRDYLLLRMFHKSLNLQETYEKKVSNDAVLQETANEIIASGDIKGKIYVDCSTVHPDTSVKIAEQISAAGGEFVAGKSPTSLF